MEGGRRLWVILVGTALTCGCCCLDRPADESTAIDLLAPSQMANWVLCAQYEHSPAWTLEDGVYWGHGSLVAYDQDFTDFVLEAEFLFDGRAEGGIQIRSDKDAERPWEVGYELDVDWAGDRVHGHIHFPVNPKPYTGDAVFQVGEWQAVRIEAVGPRVTVDLNGERVIEFEDDRFASGVIALQGEVNGVRYRNLRVTKHR